MRPANVSTTSFATSTGCVTRDSAPKACVFLLESSRPAANSLSGLGSTALACTGLSPGPTRSSRCAVASSAVASKISGNGEQQPVPERRLRASHKIDVRPAPDQRRVAAAQEAGRARSNYWSFHEQRELEWNHLVRYADEHLPKLHKPASHRRGSHLHLVE